VLWRMAIILKANKANLFVSSVLFAFWYHSPNVLDTPHMFKHHPPFSPPNNNWRAEGSVHDAYPQMSKTPINVPYTLLLCYKLQVTAFIAQSAYRWPRNCVRFTVGKETSLLSTASKPIPHPLPALNQ
jgi:hypothetical protein